MYGCAMNSANDEQFSALSSMRGQPAEAPGLLVSWTKTVAHISN